MSERKELKKRDGMRLRCRAVVERFGTKPAFKGPPRQTILLRDVIDTDTGVFLTDHLWFTAGKWSAALAAGDIFEFEARVASYIKGYRGCQEVYNAPVSQDWKLTRPTKVTVIPRESETA